MDNIGIRNSLSRWVRDTGPYSDVVISSRIRLARNLEKYFFPSRLSHDRQEEVVNEIEAVISKPGISENTEGLRTVRLEGLPVIQRQMMVEKHIISPQQAKTNGHPGKAVVLQDDEAVSIMVNEEDHLRIQVLLPGLMLWEAWDMANNIDDTLETKVTYAFDDELGYLTCCPTNLGSGLRASVMVHLPGLVLTNQVSKVLKALSQVGLAVRGLYGEGSEPLGNLFQVSNQVTLGRVEKEIIEDLISVTKGLIEQERSARELLLNSDTGSQLTDRIYRAYGILSHARIISTQEALGLLSSLRLGVDMEIIGNVEPKKLDELMVLIQPGFVQYIAGGDLSSDERDEARADLIRDYLAKDKDIGES